ncbi:NACHT domain-containing NTPase [Aerosakkonemataceae cyanobacterium BLCC-F50]|uniref:NACHT domain-containing NTPase n=1 Tax=Floridaenema flaviceps BLCC-F50 TaxID=3153642 RepID=A0ABV4XTM4_9CYAN
MTMAGGVSDKLGNRYEGRWTVFCMVDVMDEKADSISLEPIGIDGIEFFLRREGKLEYHQVKRQKSGRGRWTLSSLEDKEVQVLSDFWKSLSNPDISCVFVSTQDADELQRLAMDARDAASWTEFEQKYVNKTLNKTLSGHFDTLLKKWGNCCRIDAYAALKRIRIETVGENFLVNTVDNRLAALVEGDPASVRLELAELAENSIRKELTAHDIWHYLLKKRGYRRREWGKDPHVLTAVNNQNDRYLSRLHKEAIAGKVIRRDEVDTIVDKLISPDSKRGVLVTGEAGVGKSGIILQVVEALYQQGVPLIAFRVDHLAPTQSPNQVGEQLENLPGSPAHVLANIAQERDCVLVIDQLDAVSTASGRNPQFFESIDQIINQAKAYPRMRLLLACRKFDLDYDSRFKRLTGNNGIAETLTINRLSYEKIREIVTEIGIDARLLNNNQLKLLSIPLHLRLLAEVAEGSKANVLNFKTAKDLYKKFWDNKKDSELLRVNTEHFTNVIYTLCDYMSRNQRLSAPKARVDRYGKTAELMASEHILVSDGQQYSFFHEGFFDYAFARRFASEDEELLSFLGSREQQHLFRRAQVRQILLYERDAEGERYLADLQALLTSSNIRFHIKKVVFALLAALDNPTQEEWAIIAPLIGKKDNLITQQVWQTLRSSIHWFELLNSLGLIQQWLRDENEERIEQTVILLSIMQRQIPDLVAELVEPFIGVSEAWCNRLNFLVQRAELTTGERFFQLFLRLIDEGILDQTKEIVDETRDFWMRIYSLAQKQPEWACEAISHYLNRYLALSLGTGEPNLFHWKSGALPHSQFAKQVLTKSARNVPTKFIKYLLPFMLRVMEATALREGNPPWLDRVWESRSPGEVYSIDDALLREMEVALSSLAENQPEDFSFIVAEQLLRQSNFETVQYLLIRAYAANGEKFADEAAAYLCEQPARLQTGYKIYSEGGIGAPFWATRQLLEAITPHCSNEHIAMLEMAILNYYSDWERTAGMHYSYGHAQFVLLEGITSSRRSESATRRQQEWQRKFGKESVEAPKPIVASLVGSPIPESATQKMTDEQWLRAIQRYNQHGLDFNKNWSLAGGAGELSHLLERQVKIEPKRFAALVKQFPNDTHPSYFEAVLRGIADINVDIETIIRLSQQLFLGLVSQSSNNRHPSYVKAVLRSIADLDINLEIDISVDIKTDIGAVCQRCHQLPNHPCGRWINWLIGELADLPWSEEAFDIVTWYAVNDPEPEQEWWRTETYNEQVYWGGDIVYAESTRGSAVSAIAKLILADKNRASYFQQSLQQIVQDSSIAVRSCAAEALKALLNYDRDLAVSLFRQLCDTEDALLGTHTVECFLSYALQTHFEVLASIVERMIMSELPEVVKVGTRQACIASLNIEEAGWLAELCLSGTETHRIAATEIFVANFRQGHFRKFCENALIKLFHDSSEQVRSQATRCFLHFEGEELSDYISLVEAFVDSPAFSSDDNNLIYALEETTAKLPDAVTYRVCERFLEGLRSDDSDVRQRAGIKADKVSKLLLKLYNQSKDQELQLRCLDLIDFMSQMEVYGLAEALTEYEYER